MRQTFEVLASILVGILLTVGLILMMGATCEPRPIPIAPTDTEMCPDACQNLRALGCEEGEPLLDGTTCEAFCEYMQDEGHWLNPKCISSIERCSEIESCGEMQ